MKLYDAHNHLQLAGLIERETEIFAALEKLNVVGVVVNGVGEGDWSALAGLARRRPSVIPAFGLHPWETGGASRDWMTKLQACLDEFPFCVGEIGLDKWIDGHDISIQGRVFKFQLEEAGKRNLPVTIHCLKAWRLMLEMLRDLKPCRFLLHSYSGSSEMIPAFIELNGYFSISGYFANPGKEMKREVLKHVPLDRLLVETDAPDMLPPPAFRPYPLVGADEKQINHPANIGAVYDFTSKLFQRPPEEFALQIERNFKVFFNLSQD